MIKSMTGFGRGEFIANDLKIVCEMKAVNHRYSDINIKIPRKFSFFETEVRNFLKKEIQRGKVDVFISYEDLADRTSNVQLHEELGREYFMAISKLAESLGIPNDATAYRISRFPEVLTLEETEMNQENAQEVIIEALKLALEQFMESRVKEGENLRADIISKLDGMNDKIVLVEERYPQMVSDYRNKLETKVHELLSDVNIDESRIATEVIIYADKIAVDEETVRLRSHITAMKEELLAGGNIGRKLDFIAQEMNREANTILSKCNDKAISNIAIDLKTEIEKIREQVQNIE
ncbi:MAG: YicC/YloC family endoribonuclease [Eubacteriales bacterium]|nr:YicC/YloC family endoribonuclease [Eubacteriales bacterium]